jgi:hypothetical protein
LIFYIFNEFFGNLESCLKIFGGFPDKKAFFLIFWGVKIFMFSHLISKISKMQKIELLIKISKKTIGKIVNSD